MTLSSNVSVKLAANLSNALDQGTVDFPARLTDTLTLPDGSASGQANNVFTDTRTIGGSSDDDLDLSGTLTNAFGDVLNFTLIKVIVIKAAAANGGDLTVGGATNEVSTIFGATGDKINVPPGGQFVISAPDAGFAVTATTADELRISNLDAGSADYDIAIIGVTS